MSSATNTSTSSSSRFTVGYHHVFDSIVTSENGSFVVRVTLSARGSVAGLFLLEAQEPATTPSDQ